MEPLGGFASYLGLRRLDRVRLDPASPAKSHFAIGQMAGAWGFVSHSSFSKSFRQCFGLSPRTDRAMAADARVGAAEMGGEQAWSHWLAALK